MQESESTLTIINMVLRSELQNKKRIVFNTLVEKSNLNWIIINEERSPIIQLQIDTPEVKANGKPRKAVITLWASGKIVINGVRTREEAQQYLDMVIIELTRLHIL